MEVDKESMEVEQLARTAAEILHKLPNWAEHYDPSKLFHVHHRLKVLAWNRAQTTGGDFDTVLKNIHHDFFHAEALILSSWMEPREVAMKVEAVTEQERGETCGVCQEDFEVGVQELCVTSCMHKFHGFCLWKWLEEHRTCPLCRYKIY